MKRLSGIISMNTRRKNALAIMGMADYQSVKLGAWFPGRICSDLTISVQICFLQSCSLLSSFNTFTIILLQYIHYYPTSIHSLLSSFNTFTIILLQYIHYYPPMHSLLSSNAFTIILLQYIHYYPPSIHSLLSSFNTFTTRKMVPI